MTAPSDGRALVYGNIDRIMANAQKFRAEETVSLIDLLTDDFMAEHTDLDSIGALFALAGEQEVSEDALARIPDEFWEGLVRAHSGFESWSDMFTAATQTLVRQRLLDGCEA
ncbi:hypothetical protein R3X27_18390 [Tropicimonas sp. TH_r6]|uniref:hypothetical protein n=1 Tax=Tropicimonas sp. TH_r6 TaxID=3082085 RepID=UPI00295469FB|nr:hypothetical protein [Tropicimonas sp. TH_r6]MDV7144653.1 hypothetical protein [Tropicimonas sp. TH_r6]